MHTHKSGVEATAIHAVNISEEAETDGRGFTCAYENQKGNVTGRPTFRSNIRAVPDWLKERTLSYGVAPEAYAGASATGQTSRTAKWDDNVDFCQCHRQSS